MLKYLHIENIAVIEKSDIEFESGFNVLTGETGAGKSIVIDSINAVLGERTSRDLIRSGCDTACVSAVFTDLGEDALRVLSENGIEPDEENNIIVFRKLSASGKGIIKINDVPVTAGTLKGIAGYLINIHGQHDNQALLSAENHISFVDAVANIGKNLDEYYKEFKNLNAIRKSLRELETDEDEKQRKTELLKYQINELESADIKTGEIERLKKELETVKNYEKNLRCLNEAYLCLRGDDDTSGAIEFISKAGKQLSLVGEGFSTSAERLSEAAAAIDAISAEILDYIEDRQLAELDPETINGRLDLLSKLKVKYGSTEEEMLEFLNQAKKQLENIEFSEEKEAELASLLDESTERLISLADILTDKRKKSADEFAKKICDVLSYLNMPDVEFRVNIEKGRYTKLGCDSVEFLISANAGETAKPLSKIASGGELSRVMLAIKSVLSDRDKVDTLIFDEIDTGISGYAAGKVGNQLKKVSGGRQVICVTHLAQIAAQANNHLVIEKTAERERTFTKVRPVSGDERIAEIARIMSGSSLTENLYNSAKELLDRSSNDENL
ncbi:MAG: DNA repair protein RecN [Clostridia bacterium]|nr:DNA repair protein RecN [Clostridia bacterium]